MAVVEAMTVPVGWELAGVRRATAESAVSARGGRRMTDVGRVAGASGLSGAGWTVVDVGVSTWLRRSGRELWVELEDAEVVVVTRGVECPGRPPDCWHNHRMKAMGKKRQR